MAVALVLIGPVMFIFSRRHALDSALARIKPGETATQVVAAMGRPQRQARMTSPRADLEYRYAVWPLPGAWVVDFRRGRVIATGRR